MSGTVTAKEVSVSPVQLLDLLLEPSATLSCVASARQAHPNQLETFQAVLGGDVTVERVEHILAGSRRCAYRVIPTAASKEVAVDRRV